MREETKKLFLDAFTVSFCVYLIFISVEALVLGRYRISLSIVGRSLQVSSYSETGLAYAVLGLYLWKKYGYKMWTFFLLIAIAQEQSWGLAYANLHNAWGIQTFGTLYSLGLWCLLPIVLILHLKWFDTSPRKNLGSLAFPIYFAFYYWLGMPEQLIDARPGIVHTSNPFFELVFVLTLMLFFLCTFKLKLREKNDQKHEVTAQ